MAQKCVHKGCGKTFTDDQDECVYHPEPAVFHEGTKGWKCCKPRVLDFDEFMNIPGCTTGRHSTVDDTPALESKPQIDAGAKPVAQTNHETALPAPAARLPQTQQASPRPPASPAPPEDESDDPSAAVPSDSTCRRRGCNATYTGGDRDHETCVSHQGFPIFHEGSKGYTCCKRRVLEFDEFLKIEGCTTKKRHNFLQSKKTSEETLEKVRSDYYQTPSSVIASLFLKKIERDKSSISFTPTAIDLDLKTSDNKRYKQQLPLFGNIDTAKSSYKIMGTKVEFNLVKADGTSWPVLRADETPTGEIIQTGRAGRA